MGLSQRGLRLALIIVGMAVGAYCSAAARPPHHGCFISYTSSTHTTSSAPPTQSSRNGGVLAHRPLSFSARPSAVWRTRIKRRITSVLNQSNSERKPARSSTKRSSSRSSHTTITDWVVQGLEPDEDADDTAAVASLDGANDRNHNNNSNTTASTSTGRITSRSAIRAGENDTLPVEGLAIGKMRILAADSPYQNNNDTDPLFPIRLLVGRNGWGTGVHPTTRLCLEWLCSDTLLQGGETVLDYGCGSGILSIAALHLGAANCIGVDVEAEALVTAVRNVELNGYADGRFAALHTRQILPYEITTNGVGVDVCVANILVGQLVRPSMVAALVTNLAPGGYLCLSGIRPGEQVASLQRAYGKHVEWLDGQYAELAASETAGSIDSYGFDCGTWCRLVGRKKTTGLRAEDVADMSESAVS